MVLDCFLSTSKHWDAWSLSALLFLPLHARESETRDRWAWSARYWYKLRMSQFLMLPFFLDSLNFRQNPRCTAMYPDQGLDYVQRGPDSFCTATVSEVASAMLFFCFQRGATFGTSPPLPFSVEIFSTYCVKPKCQLPAALSSFLKVLAKLHPFLNDQSLWSMLESVCLVRMDCKLFQGAFGCQQNSLLFRANGGQLAAAIYEYVKLCFFAGRGFWTTLYCHSIGV